MDKQELRGLTIRTEEDLEDLSDEDVRWLLERDKIPNEMVEAAGVRLKDLYEESVSMADRGNTGTVRSISTEELEKELQRRRDEEEENPNREIVGNPSFDEDDDDDDEEDEDDEEEDEDEEDDYLDGWDNDRRRAELARRGLSVDGKKDELIARLIRADNDELTDEDKAPA